MDAKTGRLLNLHIVPMLALKMETEILFFDPSQAFLES